MVHTMNHAHLTGQASTASAFRLFHARHDMHERPTVRAAPQTPLIHTHMAASPRRIWYQPEIGEDDILSKGKWQC